MSLGRKELKKVLSNSKFKSDESDKKKHTDLIENLVDNLEGNWNKEYMIFFNSIIQNDKEAFESTLNFIASNKDQLNVEVNGEKKKAINISKTLISAVKSRRDLEILGVAVKSGFFDFKNKDFYTPTSIDIIKEYGSKELKNLIKPFNKTKRKKNSAKFI